VQFNTEQLIGRPAPLTEESEVVIMIAVRDRRDAWVGPSVRARLDYERALAVTAFFIESEMALFAKRSLECASKLLDTADIVIALGKAWKRRNRE